MGKRDVLSFAVVVGFTLMLAGTSKSKSDPPTKPEPTSLASRDVDLATVNVLAKCATSQAHPACRILKDFEAAMPYVETGKVVWYGESIGIGGGGDQWRESYFVQIEQTTTGPAGAARTLDYDNPTEKADGLALFAAVKTGKTVPASKAAAFMRTAPIPGGPRALQKTSGRSLVFADNPPKSYVRRSGNRLLMVEYDGNPLISGRANKEAKAWVAELWLLPP